MNSWFIRLFVDVSCFWINGILAISVIVGIVLYGYAIHLALKLRSMQNVHGVFILSRTFSGIFVLIGLFCCSLMLMTTNICFGYFASESKLLNLTIDFFIVLMFIGCYSVVNVECFMSIGRCIAICTPFAFDRYFANNSIHCYLTVIWLLTLLEVLVIAVCSIGSLKLNIFCISEMNFEETSIKVLGLILTFAPLIVAIVFDSVSYIILRQRKNQTEVQIAAINIRNDQNQSTTSFTETQKLFSQGVSAMLIVVIQTVAFHLIALKKCDGWPQTLNISSVFLLVLILHGNVTIQLISNKDFRRKIHNLWPTTPPNTNVLNRRRPALTENDFVPVSRIQRL
ncbi:hypothetical protein M3Y95_00551000 [Aphelenchoides besseyi]|nr:hypothetical protein M3Y95_00551000 [Aphelenchoides besseyi]